MKFSVFKAGRATRRTRERIGDTERMFIDLLARPGDQWDVHDVEHGEFPESVNDYDGFVISGGPASVNDQDPWVLRLLETVRQAHRENISLLGICFGHQVVARALGGEAEVNPKGWDIGLTEVELTPQGRELAALMGAPQPLRILETHRDVITKLPPGAVHLAQSELTLYEMFHLGESVLCLQGHPEMDNEEVREIISRRRESLPEQVAEAGLASLSRQPHRAFLQKLLQDFLEGKGLQQQGAIGQKAV